MPGDGVGEKWSFRTTFRCWCGSCVRTPALSIRSFRCPLQPAMQTGPCYPSCRTTSHSAYMRQLPPTVPLSRSSTRVSIVFAAPESASDATPIIRLAFSSRKPPAPREHPWSTLVVHSGVSHRAFPAPAYAAEAGRRRSRLLIRTSYSMRRKRMGLHPRGWGTAPSPFPLLSVCGAGSRVTDRLETAGIDMGGRARTHRRGWTDMHRMLKGIRNSNARSLQTYPMPTTKRKKGCLRRKKSGNEARKDPVNLNEDRWEGHKSKSRPLCR
ncbi:hypothetical protein FIBSPDRAFT_591741 [Athelia psychrophila]|uniref:Uncharacterized protein n=1 Tax=Athelia psychrophila TaxID=1759441 RepID=A0A166H3R4_9AGAM|nr:hypothetical protein FIBSPDRAFT_591741 [Fibularhizoctonia sp. CBS 109695]